MRLPIWSLILILVFAYVANAQRVTEWTQAWRDAKKISLARPKNALKPKFKYEDFPGVSYSTLTSGNVAHGAMESYQFRVTRVLGPRDMLLSINVWLEDYPTDGFMAGDSVRILGPIDGREFACYENVDGSFSSARVIRVLPKDNPHAVVSGKRADESVAWPVGTKVLSPQGVFRAWTQKKIEGRLQGRQVELKPIQLPIKEDGKIELELRNGAKQEILYKDLTTLDACFVNASKGHLLASRNPLVNNSGSLFGPIANPADLPKVRIVSHVPFKLEQVIGADRIVLSRIPHPGLPAPEIKEPFLLLSGHTSEGLNEGDIIQLQEPIVVTDTVKYQTRDGAMREALQIAFLGDSATIEKSAETAVAEWEKQFRIWTSTVETKVEARMIGKRGVLVQLEKRDGSKINVPLSKLVKADQEHVRSQVRKNRP